ncbi:MAG: hypothetical protein RLZZ337_1141, partial [Bacteroidota bacterium]
IKNVIFAASNIKWQKQSTVKILTSIGID